MRVTKLWDKVFWKVATSSEQATFFVKRTTMLDHGRLWFTLLDDVPVPAGHESPWYAMDYRSTTHYTIRIHIEGPDYSISTSPPFEPADSTSKDRLTTPFHISSLISLARFNCA